MVYHMLNSERVDILVYHEVELDLHRRFPNDFEFRGAYVLDYVTSELHVHQFDFGTTVPHTLQQYLKDGIKWEHKLPSLLNLFDHLYTIKQHHSDVEINTIHPYLTSLVGEQDGFEKRSKLEQIKHLQNIINDYLIRDEETNYEFIFVNQSFYSPDDCVMGIFCERGSLNDNVFIQTHRLSEDSTDKWLDIMDGVEYAKNQLALKQQGLIK